MSTKLIIFAVFCIVIGCLLGILCVSLVLSGKLAELERENRSLTWQRNLRGTNLQNNDDAG